MTSKLKDLKVYTTYPHTCSYLPDKEATTLFVDPRQNIDVALYTGLSSVGFRRSGNHLYRPHCTRCSECIPARIVVNDFLPNRSQRRTVKRNQDIKIELCDSILSQDAYNLYSKYITLRHAYGDMYPPTREQYESFLNNSLDCTEYYQFKYRGRLLAISVIDVLNDGISAIYTFFDPDIKDRGLGSYSILWQVEYARALSLNYVYLGYWIKDCQKMSYKSSFQPLQLYKKGDWH